VTSRKVLQRKGGEEMDPRVEDYMDSTCVASTGGVMRTA